MVAVVTGNGLGLFNTSLNTLGGGGVLGQGGFGQAGGQALVNASNGNLVLQFTDRQLSGLGLDLLHTRTYNTQGNYSDAEGDGWRWDGERRVALNGELNGAGSSVVRTTGDGHETLYRWNGSSYQSTDGDGAHDSLSWDAARSEWVWSDGSRRTEERYAGTSGRLVQVSDALGTRIDYSYDEAGRLSSVKDASGQELVLVYNAAGQLERLDTWQLKDTDQTQKVKGQQIYYGYDAQGRLASVTTDLTPGNDLSDGKVYTTTYTYDGASFRIASVSQSDGTSVSFTYELVGGEYRVKTVTDASGTTTFSYDTANRRTDISNGLNQQWSYFYDEAERLVEVRTPAVNGQRLSTRYAYDADGNVTQVTDGRGNAITYGYDANGNRVLERDAQGNTLRWVYGTNNQLLNEIRYSQPAVWTGSAWNEPPASSAQVVRYAYDTSGRLRYVVSATGVVSEYRYNGQGLRTQERSYGDANYDLSALTAEAGLDEAQLNTWAAARNLARSSLTELVYDYRGNLQRSTRYAKVDASGVGVLDAATSISEYIYGERGELLNSFVLRGSTRTRVEQSSFGYDGLGRLLSQTDASGTRNYAYDGAGRTVVVSNSAGLTTTQAYDAQGRLLSLTQSGAELTSRITQYRYDAAGRQVMVQDATGVRSYTFYDEAGRISAQVDGLGAVVEYRYNEAGQKSSEIRYATLVDTSGWYSGGVMTKTLVSQIRPPLNAAQDRTTSYAYDSAGRLSSSTDALGYVTTYRYDGRGQLIQTQNGERSTRTFYDAEGRVAAVLDGEGYLRENFYNAAGQLSRAVRYANATDPTLRATGTLEQLRLTQGSYLQVRYYYDAAGRQVGSVDEQGFVSETVYDDAGNRQQSIRYATVYSTAITASTSFASIRDAANAAGGKQTSTIVYDDYGRVSQRIGTDGSVTAYEYDSAGRLVREIRAQGTSEARSSTWRYDALGQTLGKLTGEGANRLTAGMTDAQVKATYAQYGLTYAFDAAGRQLSVSDAAGNTLLSYYDAGGRLTHTVNKLGEVTETAYNAFGEAISRTRFHDRLSDTAGLTGGLLTTPLSALTQAMRSNAKNSTTRYAYDLRGQLASSTDALGYQTTYGYSRFGEQNTITRTIAQGATPKTTTTNLSYNKRGELVGQTEDVGGLARSSATQYDAFGRVIARTDGRGLTSTIRYDNGGRIVVTTNPLNQSQTTTYDAFARVLQQSDALSRITTYAYDDVNRTLTQTLPGGVQVVTTRNRHGETLSVKDGNGNTTSYSYNKDGQLLTSTNALNQVTTHAYDDKSGFKLSTTDAAGNVTRYTYDEVGRTLTVTDALNAVTRYDYDGLGRKIRVTEAEGTSAQRITDYLYDAKDQLLQVIQDPDGLKLSTSYQYDGLGRQLEVSRGTVAAPRQQVTKYEFDNLGRRTAERVDPDGLNLTTRYVYNKNDQVEQKIQVLDASTSYTTRYAYDNAGQLLSTTDAAGKIESYTYDAVGNRKTLTNKNGHVWTYNYDSRNRLIEEITPPLYVASIDAAGTVTARTARAVTQIAYDKMGNVLSRTEGVIRLSPEAAPADDDFSQARTTSYTYDKLNRQVGITSPGWYNKATGAFQSAKDAVTPANTFQVTTEVTYDTAGNAVRNRVRVNNTGTAATDYVDSYKIYDKLGRVTHEIDALGGVTAHTYDSLGNQVTTKRFANGLTGSVPARGYYVTSDIVTKTDAAATTGNLLLDSAADRTLTTGYDKAGRKAWVRQDQVSIYTFTGNASTSTTLTVAPTTVYTYDALGRVVKETLVGRDSAGATAITGASTTYYYDNAGNRIGSVDALGYYTRMEYDNLGRLTRQVEYSTALTSWSQGAVPTPPASADADRSKAYGYDAMGRVTQVTCENVMYWVQDATDFGGKVTSTETRGNIVESKTTYDAVGNIKTITDALGNVTTTEYNSLGQITKVTEPQRWAAKNVIDPISLGFDGVVLASPTVTRLLNAFGQVIRETRAAGTDASGNVQSGVTQHSRTVYDAAGHEVKSIDASNAVETYKVDVAGRRVEEFQQISMTLNAWTWLDGNKLQYTQDIKRTFQYDKLGQQTATTAWYGDWDGQTKAAKESVEYNRFGEITAKKINGEHIELYNYNQVGRVVSYANMQKWIVAVDYDLAGNATRSNQIGQLWGSADDDRITYTRYDKLGRVIEQHLPAFSANTSADTLNNVTLAKATPVIKQVFDRWGNVTQRIDARGQGTLYNYDHNNRVWAETYAATDILRENGTTYRANTMQQRHYDAVGKHIATQDWVWPYSGQTNFTLLRTRHNVYNQVGEMEREVDALGNWRTYRVDAHGNRIATLDAIGVVTVDTYDAMDRQVTHGIMRNGARTILLTNRYDQAGRLVAEITGSSEVEETLQSVANTSNWSSSTTGAKGNTRYTLRDARGNIQWTRNESGIQMRYGYDAYSRKINEWDGLGNTQTWTYAAGDWSRLTNHKDLGGRTFTYTYNLFGELDGESFSGTDKTYSYYENGLLKSTKVGNVTKDAAGALTGEDSRTTTYAYDLAGNRVREINAGRYFKVGVIDQSASNETRTSYDERGRLKSMKTPAGSQLAGSLGSQYTAIGTARLDSLVYSYDELGSRRNIFMDTTDQSGKRTMLDNWYAYDLEGRVLRHGEFWNLNGKDIMSRSMSGAGSISEKEDYYLKKIYYGNHSGYLGDTPPEARVDNRILISYDAAGRRKTTQKFVRDTWWSEPVDSLYTQRWMYGGYIDEVESYTYNDLGQLLGVTGQYLIYAAPEMGPSPVPIADIKLKPPSYLGGLYYKQISSYDLFGNKLSLRSYKIPDPQWGNNKNTSNTLTTYGYRGDGMLTVQMTYNMDSGQRLTQATYFGEAGMIDGVGNQLSYRYAIYKSDGGVDYRGSYSTAYAIYGAYKEAKVTATMTKTSTPGVTTSTYSDRGELLRVDVTGASSYSRMFASNRDGQLIAVKEKDGVQSHVYFDGREVANIGNANSPEITDTVELTTKSAYGLTPSSHVVTQGDTLQSIALQVWGDDAMWYLIADANGLVASSTLMTGDTLKIPSVLGSTHNDSNDFKPYDPSDVVGDTTPRAKLPKPKKKKKSGGLSSIVMAVVAVVAAVFTAGAAAAAFAAIGTSTGIGTAALAGGMGALGIGAGVGAAGLGLAIGPGAIIGGGIVGGAVGSAAGQLAGMAMGVVDSFSWSQVAVGALSGGIAAGMSVAAQGMLGGAAEGFAGAVSTNFVTQGAFGYATNYAVNKVVGLETSFSWKGMVSSITGSAIGSAVGGKLFGGDSRFAGIARAQTAALTSAAINDKWFGGARPNYGQVALDAFGNSLANYVVDKIGEIGAESPRDAWKLKPSEMLADIGSPNAMSDTVLLYDPYDIDPVPNSILDKLNLNIEELVGLNRLASEYSSEELRTMALVCRPGDENIIAPLDGDFWRGLGKLAVREATWGALFSDAPASAGVWPVLGGVDVRADVQDQLDIDAALNNKGVQGLVLLSNLRNAQKMVEGGAGLLRSLRKAGAEGGSPSSHSIRGQAGAADNEAGIAGRTLREVEPGIFSKQIELALNSNDLGALLEGQLGKALDQKGLLLDYQSKIRRGFEPNGRPIGVGEIDAETPNYIIEVASGAKPGKLDQLRKLQNNILLNPDRKPVILFAPKLIKPQQIKAYEKIGVRVVSDYDQLFKFDL